MPWLEWSPAVAEALSHLESARDLSTLNAARGALHAVTASSVHPEVREALCLAAAQERGGTKIGKHLIGRMSNDTAKEAQQRAWLALHTGADWHGARAALAVVESNQPDVMMVLLWKAVCATRANNRAAIDELKALLGSADEPYILDPLLRGLGATGQFDEADRVIADLGLRHSLAPWMVERLLADTRLEADDSLVDAIARLTALTTDESLPLVHRAEIWHNLGTAQERLGLRDAAVAAFEQAAALNPFLDAAREEIERLRAPGPNSSP